MLPVQVFLSHMFVDTINGPRVSAKPIWGYPYMFKSLAGAIKENNRRWESVARALPALVRKLHAEKQGRLLSEVVDGP